MPFDHTVLIMTRIYIHYHTGTIILLVTSTFSFQQIKFLYPDQFFYIHPKFATDFLFFVTSIYQSMYIYICKYLSIYNAYIMHKVYSMTYIIYIYI